MGSVYSRPRPQVIACPQCDNRFMFFRSSTPQIDCCGFESCSLECEGCGAPLAGIVDPYDETLLLSQNDKAGVLWVCMTLSAIRQTGREGSGGIEGIFPFHEL